MAVEVHILAQNDSFSKISGVVRWIIYQSGGGGDGGGGSGGRVGGGGRRRGRGWRRRARRRKLLQLRRPRCVLLLLLLLHQLLGRLEILKRHTCDQTSRSFAFHHDWLAASP